MALESSPGLEAKGKRLLFKVASWLTADTWSQIHTLTLMLSLSA